MEHDFSTRSTSLSGEFCIVMCNCQTVQIPVNPHLYSHITILYERKPRYISHQDSHDYSLSQCIYIYTPDYTSIYGYKVGPPVVLPIDPMKYSYIPHTTNNVVSQLDAIRATGTPPCTLR